MHPVYDLEVSDGDDLQMCEASDRHSAACVIITIMQTKYTSTWTTVLKQDTKHATPLSLHVISTRELYHLWLEKGIVVCEVYVFHL